MCQWCNLLMFVAFLYLYNSKEFLFSFGFGYFIKLWIYPLLFVAFFFRRLCIWGAPRTFDTLEPTLANFFIYTLSPTISNVTWLSLLLLILWFEAAASTPPSHLGLCFFPRYFGQDIFDMVSVRSAFVSETLWSNTLFRFFFVQYVCCFVVVYFCMSDLLNASTVPGQWMIPVVAVFPYCSSQYYQVFTILFDLKYIFLYLDDSVGDHSSLF